MLAEEDRAGAGGDLHDVYFRLRSSILDGVIAPGEILNQVHIAQRLGVSRTPVREAMRILQAEGLVEAQFQHRMRVTPITPQEVDAVYAMWILAQALAILVTVPQITAADLARIQAAFSAMREESPERAGSETRWSPLHRTFHGLLIMHAAPSVAAAIDNCWSRSERARRTFARPGAESWAESEREHTELVEAFAERAAQRAAAVATRQLRRVALEVIGRIDPTYRPCAIEAATALAGDPTGARRGAGADGAALRRGRSGSRASRRG